jgi:hypothetical protein
MDLWDASFLDLMIAMAIYGLAVIYQDGLYETGR